VPVRAAALPAQVPTPPTSGGVFQPGSPAIVNDDVKLRTGPSPDAAVAVELPRGTEVTVLAGPREGGGFTWWLVQDPATSTVGFVREEFLSPKG
jgi:hypothetical protein